MSVNVYNQILTLPPERLFDAIFITKYYLNEIIKMRSV